MSRLLQRAFVGFGTASSVVLALLAYFTPWTGAGPKPDEHPFFFLVWQYRTPLIIAFAVVGVIAPLIAYRPGQRRETVRHFLEYLHQRSWARGIGRNPDFRLSFWVPTWRGQLKCVYRTDGHPSRRRWEMNPKTDGDGVVGHVWKYGVMSLIDALPANPSQQDKDTYLQKTFLDQTRYSELSWPGAEMAAIRVIGSAGEALGVLLVESRNREAKISVVDQFYSDAGVFAMVWEGRL